MVDENIVLSDSQTSDLQTEKCRASHFSFGARTCVVYVCAIEEIWVVCCILVGCQWIKAKAQEKRESNRETEMQREKLCHPTEMFV